MANPITIGLGGSSLTAIDRRTNESTMTIRVKHVSEIRRAGNTDSAVSRSAISMAAEKRSPRSSSAFGRNRRTR